MTITNEEIRDFSLFLVRVSMSDIPECMKYTIDCMKFTISLRDSASSLEEKEMWNAELDQIVEDQRKSRSDRDLLQYLLKKDK